MPGIGGSGAGGYSLSPVEHDPFVMTPAGDQMVRQNAAAPLGTVGADPTGLTAPAHMVQPQTITPAQAGMASQPLQPANVVAGAGNVSLSNLASGLAQLQPAVVEAAGAGGANGGISASAGVGQTPAQAATSGYGVNQNAMLLQNASPTMPGTSSY